MSAGFQLVVLLLLLPLVAVINQATAAATSSDVRPMIRERPTPPSVATRLGPAGRNRPRRPLQKIEPTRDDPSKFQVIKHPNGTLTYVFPESISQQQLAYHRDWTPQRMPDDVDSGDLYFPQQLVPRQPQEISTRESFVQCSPDYPICTNVVNYPQKLVNEIVSQHEHRFAEVFGNDVVVDSGDQLDKRFDTSDDEFLCTSREKLVHPQSGYTMNKRLVVIVNTPSYTQGVRIETCVAGGRPCDKLEHMLSFYRTECKQLYHYRTLLAIDPATNQPYKESFRVPSCCKCVMMALRRDSRYGH